MPNSEPSRKAMEAEMATLNANYAANQERISYLQKLQTPGLSKLSKVASQRHKLPLLPGQYYKMGASGAIASFKYPDGVNIGIQYPIARPHSKSRVQVVLTQKEKKGKKGGRSRKHKVKSQRCRKSSRRNH